MKIKLQLNQILINMIKTKKETINSLKEGLMVDNKTINNYLKGTNISPQVQNSLFDYIITKNYDLFDLINIEDNSYYYHMSSSGIIGTISSNYNKNKFTIYGNDFGYGFYLNESFKTASLYIKKTDYPHIYRFKRSCFKELIPFSYIFKETDKGSQEWVLFIGVNRNKIINESYKSLINEKIVSKLKKAKLLIGKIADSLNFEVMDDFFNNIYDIYQVKSQLTKANLGLQYVIKDENFSNSLKYDDEIIFSKDMLNIILKWRKYCNDKLREDNIKSLRNISVNSENTFNKIMEKMSKDE